MLLRGGTETVTIVAEIGINHNGRIDLAHRLIDTAKDIGVDFVKFQKRTISLTDLYAGPQRQTPDGVVSYIQHRKLLELSNDCYKAIDEHCNRIKIPWFASCWDEPAVEFIANFNPPLLKLPSARLQSDSLVERMVQEKCPLVLSTGFSYLEDIKRVVGLIGNRVDVTLTHTTSAYPAPTYEANLRVLRSFRKMFDCYVGYSDHTASMAVVLGATALGLNYLEFHLTLDRGMWGSDHLASWEPNEARELVRQVRVLEGALGDGLKAPQPSEDAHTKRLT